MWHRAAAPPLVATPLIQGDDVVVNGKKSRNQGQESHTQNIKVAQVSRLLSWDVLP